MASEIVQDNDVSGLEGLDELLFDIGQEAHAINRPVEDAGCGEPVATKRRDEGHGAPMPIRREACQALSLWPPTAQRRHVGLDPCLVNEHEAFGIKPGLPGFPTSPTTNDRRPTLFKSEQRFF